MCSIRAQADRSRVVPAKVSDSSHQGLQKVVTSFSLSFVCEKKVAGR
jgi:hypothetical protein